jgi:hypothetical protein
LVLLFDYGDIVAAELISRLPLIRAGLTDPLTPAANSGKRNFGNFAGGQHGGATG